MEAFSVANPLSTSAEALNHSSTCFHRWGGGMVFCPNDQQGAANLSPDVKWVCFFVLLKLNFCSTKGASLLRLSATLVRSVQ